MAAPASPVAADAARTADPSAYSGESTQEKKLLYTFETLAQHNTREELWMLLHDKVYDVTAFMDEHPGGDEVLLEEAGRDATEAFEDVGHSDEARDMLKKMYLGEFQGEKKGKAKKGSSSTGTSSSSSSGFPTWTIPLALFVAFLAWRLLFA
ncbi:cytochrome b5 [Cryptococcus gattii E566]|uniref:Cytochrome b5, putative n=2 Tax=Cryptococcus gattii TaxID=37769 RepID=E6RE45_CRYGW|nr:cytochrome b5, putative [Cryptococcus gattii WM276]ADV25287.1 cytochrome b5, putative [Cryptococcus gattii WM276]KIR76635.1 cytochrome b5 [Cryptococcus gattii EJB2]KIY32151.1 cytochrome b5 [Cryptococcus gattii E566]